MTDQREEILIQRCVDNECTSSERQELIERMNASKEGWKTLACTYMEEQLFAAGCNSQSKTVPVAVPQVIKKPQQHWFNHPAMSMVLSACVVFLLGVVGVGEYHRLQTSEQAVAVDTNSGNVGGESITSPIVDAATVASESGAQTAWLEADGLAPRELPIYQKVSEYIPKLDEFRQQGSQWSKGLGARGAQPRISYKVVRTNDGLLLLPVEEFYFEQQMQ